MDSGDQNAVVCLGACGGIFASLGLLAMFTIGTVPPLHYGIVYNHWGKSADMDSIFEGGRYPIYPWKSFLLYPSSFQTVEFTNEPALLPSGVRYPKLHARTKDGLALYLQVSLQYRLTKEDVGKLYAEFNDIYQQTYVSTIRDVLIKAAADYEAIQLWEDRAKVGQRMQSMIDEALGNIYAVCWGLQLMSIELPDGFENSIVRTQVWEQRVQTRRFEQDGTRIRAHTTVIAAEYDKNVTIIKAHGHANYTYITKEAQALAKQRSLHIEARVLRSAREKLGLRDLDLVAYQRFSSVKTLTNATILYGFAGATGSDGAAGAAPARQAMSPAGPPLPLPPLAPLPGAAAALPGHSEAEARMQMRAPRQLDAFSPELLDTFPSFPSEL